jgi:hypothetical protein
MPFAPVLFAETAAVPVLDGMALLTRKQLPLSVCEQLLTVGAACAWDAPTERRAKAAARATRRRRDGCMGVSFVRQNEQA